jgi:ribonuclease P protein component
MSETRTAAEPSGGSEDQSFPVDRRIHRGAEIREILARGKRERTRLMDVFFAASPVSHSRFGLIVPKHGHRIVDRNRLRRRLREIARRELLPELRERGMRMDVLVRTHRKAYAASYVELSRTLNSAMEAEWHAES